MNETKPVGLVGLGLMGQAFAHRLLSAGFQVLGFDIDPAKGARLAAAGGQAAPSIAEIARLGDPILIAVFSTEQVEEVVERGLLPALGDASGRIVLCASTCDPDRIAALGKRVGARGLRFLETPVSGTSDQVRRGDGVALIGGAVETAEAVAPVLGALFARSFQIGAIGDGGRAKLAINLILGLNRLALAEGLVFASALGLDPEAFLRVAHASAAYSQVMDTKGAKMLRRDFSPEGRARQTLKDVRLMLDQAQRLGQDLPLLAVHHAVLESCVAHGEGDLDNSVVVEEMRRRRRAPVREGSAARPARSEEAGIKINE